MINLIPPRARAMIIKEYWLRVVAVWLFLLGTGCLLVASLLLPTYMLLRTELIALRDQVTANAAQTATFDSSSTALATAMAEAKLLQSMSTSTYTADIARLTELAGNNVSLTSFAFTTVDGKIGITITGTAISRAALASFRDTIEGDERFVDAILPISSLIKDRDIEFSMTVTSQPL
jgi:hypothetical protein